jgi:hypothetical protein
MITTSPLVRFSSEQAVVVLRRTGDGPAGDPRLVAYLAASGRASPAAGELHALLLRLPDSMIPLLFVRLGHPALDPQR